MILYQGDTRRGFVFGPIDDPEQIKQADGVRLFGKMLRFDKKNFADPYQCEQWLGKAVPDAEVLHVKRLEAKTKSIELSDQEWEEIQPFLVNPDAIDRSMVRSYKSYLANNVIDRDVERFPVKMLRNFVRTLPGKSKIFNHDWWNDAGAGRYYSATLQKVSLEEMLQMCGETPFKDFRKLAEIAQERDGGLYWLVGKYYIPATDSELTVKIDMGIFNWESIGFRAPRLDDVNDENGKLLFREWTDGDSSRTGEATEGSWVFLGSQFGARTGKSAMDSALDQSLIVEIDELIEAKFQEHNQAKEQKTMPFKMKIAGIERELDPEKTDELEQFASEVEAKITTAQTELNDLREKTTAMTTVLTAAGLNEATEDQAKVIAADAKAYRDSAIEDAMRYGGLAGVIPAEEDKAKAHRETMAKLSTAEIVAMATGYKGAYEAKNPPDQQIKDEKPDGDKDGDQAKGIKADDPNAALYVL